MKKKHFIGAILFFFFITGCKGRVTEKDFIREKLTPEIEHFVCDVPVQDIKEFNIVENLFLTKEGKLYLWNKEKFQNGQHCQAIRPQLTFKKFINGAIVDQQNNLYFYIYNELTDRIPDEYIGAINYLLYEKNPNIFLFNQNYEESDYEYATSVYHLAKMEGKKVIVYEIEDGKQVEKEIGSIPEKEEILQIEDNIIKTNKAYYYYGKINKKQCLKNSNVECLYGLTKVETATHYYKIIETYSAGYYILKKSDGIYFMKP